MREVFHKFRCLFCQYPWVVLFTGFLLLFSVADFVKPDKVRSEMENRPLAARPALSWTALMKGTYDEAYDKYMNDQFLFRDGWITLKSISETALLKTENNGVVYGKEQYQFKKYDRIDHSRFDPNLQYFHEFFTAYPELPVTFIVVPNAYEILPEYVPFGLEMVDQKTWIPQAMERAGSKNVESLNLFPVLDERKDRYLYYRTDHHWTSEGAYWAVKAFADQKGMSLPELSEIPSAENPGFYGTNYSKSKKIGTKPDVITRYEIPVSNVTVAGKTVDGLYDLQKLETRDQYAMFLWGNNNFTTFQSECNVNPVPGKKTKVLLIKDSYGNSFAPFLAYLYDEVHVMDPRYARSSMYLKGAEYDDVIVLFNFEGLEEPKINNLKY